MSQTSSAAGLFAGLCLLATTLTTDPAHAQSERGPFFFQGHVGGVTLAFPSQGDFGMAYTPELAFGYHISGRHDGFVVGAAQRFDLGGPGSATGATMARVGWDFPILLEPTELTIAPYLQGGAMYAFDGDAGGIVGVGLELRIFPIEVWKPEPGKPKERVRTERVVVRADRIEIKEKIQFKVNDSTIESVSFPLLDEVAAAIQANPHIRKLRIEGHASAEGDAGVNKRLSQSRAEAVRDHLVSEGGVDETVLEFKGYGSAKPIADNDSEEGREANRRVEFNILEQDDTTTKEKLVVEKGGSAAEGFYIVAKPFELDLGFVSDQVVPALTFQAGVGYAF